MALIGDFEVAARDAEGDKEPDQFKFCGELFTCSSKVGIIPLGRFAKAAQSGLDTAEMDGLAAMVDLLAQVVIDEDRERFLNTASKNRADADDLMPIVQAVIEAQSGNPTEQPSSSSPGPSTTGETSKALSSSEDIDSGPMRHDPSDPRAEGLVSVDQAAALMLVSG